PRPGPAPVVAPAPEVARTPAPSAEVVRPVPSPIETVQAIPAEDDPLAGSLTLAAEGDVVVEAMGPHPVWPGGMPPMTTAPGDAPMIFAAAR
ncbi:MAG: hypothetical protein K2X87_22505, partial [Gemmataceae bacterium]|nr:hypothetical protein [Gemmataceae bacterium]